LGFNRISRVADFTAGREFHPAPKNIIQFTFLMLPVIESTVKQEKDIFYLSPLFNQQFHGNKKQEKRKKQRPKSLL
jgi:hypothetical protein